MRPIKLRIKGINSYVSEQVVNFDKISQLHLFGIFGETGSGKTTILDSIVMALYGTSERDITKNIINVHTQHSYIILDFSMYVDEENVHFRVERIYKQRASGLKTDAVLTNLNTNKVLAEHSEDVNETIAKIIGIGKKEFLKCIAIPQGEFDAFLLDTPLNRKKTISKIFNLEHFGASLQEKLKKKKDTCLLKKMNIEDKLNIFQNVSDLNLSNLELELINKQKEKIDVEFLLNTSKTKFAYLSNDLSNIAKLKDIEEQLIKERKQLQEIEFFKKQIEYTNAYGNFISVNNKYVKASEEIKNLSAEKTRLKDKLAEISLNITKQTEDKKKVEKEKANLEVSLNKMNLEVVKYEQISSAMKIKEVDLYSNKLIKMGQDKKIKELQKIVDTLSKKEANLKQISEKTIKELEKTEAMLKNIEATLSLSCREDFALFLSQLEETITQEALIESMDFKIFKQVSKLLKMIDDYKTENDEILFDIRGIYSDIYKKGNNVDVLKMETEKYRSQLLEDRTKTDSQLLEVNTEKYLKQTELTTNQALKEQTVAEENKNSEEFNKLKSELATLPKPADISKTSKTLETIAKELGEKEKELEKMLEIKQQTILELEVKNTELQRSTQNLQELKDVVKMFDLGKIEKNIKENANLLLEDDKKILELKDRISAFEKNLAYLETTKTELTNKLSNITVSKEEVAEAEKQLTLAQENLNNIVVEIGLLKNKISEQQEHLGQVKDLRKELKVIQKQLDNILTLQKLISGGALLEYISEEYMYLITDFANNYVYSISKGKYLLKYNKDFYVLDNFNGGIARSIKTLSGGERFIISLSLALGLSQSIATNNNMNFNFFFIDEGFGSLSESFIDKVLQSFDALIKLDFTVGFITHVDKMKNYITNRILVNKENNELGSIITEEY